MLPDRFLFTKILHLALLPGFVLSLALPAAAQTYRIDVNRGVSPTEAGFTPLNGVDGASVNISGVTFQLFGGITGTRDRGAPDDLRRDFSFMHLVATPIGLRMFSLPAGYYEARSWHYDNAGGGGILDVNFQPQGGPSETLVTAHSLWLPPANYHFLADGSTTYELLFGGVNFGARFNGIELTRLTFPSGLTYRDANGSNTAAVGGSPNPFSTNVQAGATGTNLWYFRDGFGFDEAGNNGIYEKDGAATGGDGAPLVTTITGLSPDFEYQVYVCLLSEAGADWHLQAGLNAGALTTFSRTSPAGDVTNIGPSSVAGSTRDQLVAFVGKATPDESGEIRVYIDDLNPDTETSWYDGIAFEPIIPLERPAGSKVVADDGVWTWFNEDRATFHEGLLYAGYVRSDGEIAVSRYDPATNSSAESVLSTPASVQLDDHNNPSLTVLPDGKIIAVYSKHGSGAQFLHRTSLNNAPGSTAEWGPEVEEMVPGANNTYANTFRLTGEADKLYNFHRHLGFNPNFSTSPDNGATWQFHGEVIRAGGNFTRPYPRYVSNETDRIDFIYTDGHPNTETNSIYHLYYQANAFHNTDDSFSKPVGALPFLHDSGERGTVVYQYNTAPWPPLEGPDAWIPNGRGWTWDIQYGTDGHPVCVFSVQLSNVMFSGWVNDRIYYYYARWDGTAWQKKFIAHAGRPLYVGERHYAGGITIDPEDPRIVYISTNALDPFDLSDIVDVPLTVLQRYEIWRGMTHDGGATFAWTPVTEDSEADNLRPFVPNNHGLFRHLVWLYGRYTTFTDYDLDVLGVFNSTPLSYGDWAAFHNLPLNAPLVDTDGDGLNDGKEYVLDLDPNVMDSAGAITLDPAGFHFTLPSPKPDATVKIEASTDEADWSVIAVALPGEAFSVKDHDFRLTESGGPPNAVDVDLPPKTRVYLRLAIELTDAMSPAYLAWASSHGLPATGFGSDTDGDRLADGLEYLFDLDPNAKDSNDTITIDPAGFRFTVPLARPDTAVHIQRSRYLKEWSTIATSVAGGSFTVSDPFLTVNQSGSLPNAVEVVLPPVGSETWFLRLTVDIEGL